MDTHNADTVRGILRQLPEIFWDVHIWMPDGNGEYGYVDVADRHRIVAKLITMIDGEFKG